MAIKTEREREIIRLYHAAGDSCVIADTDRQQVSSQTCPFTCLLTVDHPTHSVITLNHWPDRTRQKKHSGFSASLSSLGGAVWCREGKLTMCALQMCVLLLL